MILRTLTARSNSVRRRTAHVNDQRGARERGALSLSHSQMRAMSETAPIIIVQVRFSNALLHQSYRCLAPYTGDEFGVRGRWRHQGVSIDQIPSAQLGSIKRSGPRYPVQSRDMIVSEPALPRAPSPPFTLALDRLTGGHYARRGSRSHRIPLIPLIITPILLLTTHEDKCGQYGPVDLVS